MECTDLGGGATTTVDGVQYGLTGRESLHYRIRGYTDDLNLMRDPDTWEKAEPFRDQVVADCKAQWTARGEHVQ